MGGGPIFLFHTPPQSKTTWHGPGVGIRLGFKRLGYRLGLG